MYYNGNNFRRVVNDKKNNGRSAIFDGVDGSDKFFDKNRNAFKDLFLPDSVFSYCVFYGMIFDNVALSYSIFTHTKFINCTFKNCVLNGATFSECSFIRTTFDGNKGKYSSSFVNCDFEDLKEINEPHDGLISSVVPMACPSTGGFIGWKAAYKSGPNGPDYCIVKLYIPADAKRSSAGGHKCRCSRAKVLGFYDFAGEKLPDDTYVMSMHVSTFRYEVGKYVKPIGSPFCEDRFEECAPGIHFFISKEEAIRYVMY